VPRAYKRPVYPNITVPEQIDPRDIRLALGYSQERFARMLGLSVRTIQAWERYEWREPKPGETPQTGVWKFRKRNVSAAGRVLLALFAADQWIIYDILSGQNEAQSDVTASQLL
jgi:hypothetical protein